MRSLVSRVAWGAGLSACGAALISAIVTAAAAAYLVQRSEDRRLSEAATVLAHELAELRDPDREAAGTVREEHHEMRHTGISFAVYDGARRRLLGGDERIPMAAPGSCATPGALRVCGTTAGRGMQVYAASAHTEPAPWLAASSVTAAIFAAALAWLTSRPVARWLVGPLSRLEARVASMGVGAKTLGDLGPGEQVAEVEALRTAIATLLARTAQAVDHASRFAADAAHELRTPLTALRGELELLAEDPSLSAGTARDLAHACRKVEHLQSLFERLLVLALPDEDGSPTRELLSVRDVVEDVIAGLGEDDRRRVTLRAGEAQGLVMGDSSLLSVLFSNGLSNALKFGRTAEVELIEEDGAVVLRIDDDGPGVPPADRERVFDPFFRSPAARGSGVRGDGLGLALVAHVARRHRGSARFEDGARGARLAVRMPPATRDETAARARGRSAQAARPRVAPKRR